MSMHRAESRHRRRDRNMCKAEGTYIACRLTGHARFRFDMLARHGPLVLIPLHHCSDHNYVREKLQEATGLPLHEAFATDTPV